MKFFGITGSRASFWYINPIIENSQSLTPNDREWPRFEVSVTSSDLGNNFFTISCSRASFWYIKPICLKIYGFWPVMTSNDPVFGQVDLKWPLKYGFRNLWLKSFILIYKTPMFESFYILTPKRPKNGSKIPLPQKNVLFAHQKFY